MAKLTRSEVEHVAKLARLKLGAEELGRAAEQLSSILQYVGKLELVPTEDVPVTAQVTGLHNIARRDAVEACPTAVRDALLSSAPDREDDFFRTTGVFADQ